MQRPTAGVNSQSHAPRSDQTKKKQSLRTSELRYRRLFESAQDGILILNASTGLIDDVNPYLIDMLGYSREEFVKKKLWEVGAFKDIEASKDSFLTLQHEGIIRYENLPLKTKNGQMIPVEFVSNVYAVGSENVIQCNIRDISDRKRAETATKAKDDAHLLMITNLEAHWLLMDNLLIGIVIHAPDTQVVACNPEASLLLGLSPKQMIGKGASDPEWHFLREDDTLMPVAEFPVNRVIATGQRLKNFVMKITRGNKGESKWILVNAYPEFDCDVLRQIIVTFADINDLKEGEQSIRRQIERLTALVEIDRAINFSFDLSLSLSTLLSHVIVQLRVDAADVMLFNPTSRTMEFVAGRGFHTKGIELARQPLCESYYAAQERGVVHIPDLAHKENSFLGELLLTGEGLVSYHGVPLVAKGHTVGVLEVFHREHVIRDPEWLAFLKALASQAAIAIDNVILFEDLQHSNAELTQAYNATIEGWSRALELRDNVTEGHAQRVATLTVKLASLFGIGPAEMVHVRWGALLHDIGKMGIPDGILLKQGPLSETEWAVMKRHTVFAYEMLSPVNYLHASLDIPYSHHEKWDGTGYPLGLKGDQIPLVARIFAVVDVWDALRSDRLYRESWSVEKVREHIASLSGTHFDPHVVDICLNSDVLVD